MRRQVRFLLTLIFSRLIGAPLTAMAWHQYRPAARLKVYVIVNQEVLGLHIKLQGIVNIIKGRVLCLLVF
jgi:hypothetical protein